MMQVSGSSLLLSVSVLMCIFTFDIQSESNANIFHISGYFCNSGFGVYETANLSNAQQYLFILTTLLYIT